MKKISRALFVAALAMVSLAASAQEHISKAIDTFGGNTAKYGIWNKTEDNGEKGAYSVIYKFKLPKKDDKKLDFLRKAFYEDVSSAYDVFKKNADDTSKSNRLIAYGDDLDKQLKLGWPTYKSGRNYLFMFVDDKNKPDYRYVYGLEWYKAGKNVEGRVVKIYSMNPQKTAEKGMKNFDKFLKDFDISKEMGSTFKMPSFMGDDIKIDKNGLTMNNGTLEMDNGKTIMKSGKKSVVIERDGTVKMDDGTGNIVVVDSKGNVVSQEGENIMNNDPIQQFGNLRAAYMNNLREGNIDNTTLLTGLANSILDLCKKKGQQMTSAEKQLCTEGLKEMQEKTQDKFIKGIFGVAISEVNKYSQK